MGQIRKIAEGGGIKVRDAWAFMDQIYRIRIERGRAAEIRFSREEHKRIFNDYPKKDCPPSLIIARVFYSLYMRGIVTEGIDISPVIRERATAVLRMEDGYAFLNTDDANLMRIADKCYNPQETKQKKREGTKMAITTAAENGTMKRIDCMGYSVTAVLRWLGKQGYSSAQARGAMTSMGVVVNPATVQIQVNAGAKGQRGEPAPLTKEQIKELEQHIPEPDAAPAEVATKPTPKKVAPKPAPAPKAKAEAPAPKAAPKKAVAKK